MKPFLCLCLALLLSSTPLAAERIPVTLEHALSTEAITWGLMQRECLPERHGMLFHYPSERKLTFWSFNCLIDLDVAFLDKDGVIRDIQRLRASPERMDPKRPVRTLKDMQQYNYFDPVVSFFREQAVTSSVPAKYALEMAAGSFAKLGIKLGDRMRINSLAAQTVIESP